MLLKEIGPIICKLINYQFGIKLIRKLINKYPFLRDYVKDQYILDKVNTDPNIFMDKRKKKGSMGNNSNNQTNNNQTNNNSNNNQNYNNKRNNK